MLKHCSALEWKEAAKPGLLLSDSLVQMSEEKEENMGDRSMGKRKDMFAAELFNIDIWNFKAFQGITVNTLGSALLCACQSCLKAWLLAR